MLVKALSEVAFFVVTGAVLLGALLHPQRDWLPGERDAR